MLNPLRIPVFVVASSVLFCGCGPPAPRPLPGPASDSSGATASAFTCSEPEVTPLPEWARAGFSPPDQSVAHFVGARGNIVAVPFGWPLRQQQPAGRSNKVLWVAQQANAGPLTIEAHRQGQADPVHREVANGPGPSIIDLPAKGCWRLDLSWPGGADSVYLRYLGPAT